ncbi:hypothetical protein GQ600_3414 [Phytophthora cactorum]|nr:hypothetical protein GQ600_3414 [Phytophthora cactorum]
MGYFKRDARNLSAKYNTERLGLNNTSPRFAIQNGIPGELKCDGWTSKSPVGQAGPYFYSKPGKSNKGVRGVDFFVDEQELMKILDRLDIGATSALAFKSGRCSASSLPEEGKPLRLIGRMVMGMTIAHPFSIIINSYSKSKVTGAESEPPPLIQELARRRWSATRGCASCLWVRLACRLWPVGGAERVAGGLRLAAGSDWRQVVERSASSVASSARPALAACGWSGTCCRCMSVHWCHRVCNKVNICYDRYTLTDAAIDMMCAVCALTLKCVANVLRAPHILHALPVNQDFLAGLIHHASGLLSKQQMTAVPHFEVVFARKICSAKVDRPASTRLALHLHARVVNTELGGNRHVLSRAVELGDKRPHRRHRTHVDEFRVGVAKEEVDAEPDEEILTQQAVATKTSCTRLKRRRTVNVKASWSPSRPLNAEARTASMIALRLSLPPRRVRRKWCTTFCTVRRLGSAADAKLASQSVPDLHRHQVFARELLDEVALPRRDEGIRRRSRPRMVVAQLVHVDGVCLLADQHLQPPSAVQIGNCVRAVLARTAQQPVTHRVFVVVYEPCPANVILSHTEPSEPSEHGQASKDCGNTTSAGMTGACAKFFCVDTSFCIHLVVHGEAPEDLITATLNVMADTTNDS